MNKGKTGTSMSSAQPRTAKERKDAKARKKEDAKLWRLYGRNHNWKPEVRRITPDDPEHAAALASIQKKGKSK